MLSARFSGRLETYGDSNVLQDKQDILRPTLFQRADIFILLDHYPDSGHDKSIIACAGQTLSGRVIYSTKDCQDLDCIAVTLKGKCAVTTSTKTSEGVFKDRVKTPLFRQSCIVVQGPVRMETNATQVWPFSFVLPEKTQYSRVSAADAKASTSGHFQDNLHDIPPTMDVDFSDTKQVEIYYTLKVKAVPYPRTFRTHEKAISVIVPALGVAASQQTEVTKLPVPGRHSWASGSLRCRQPTMREKFNQVLSGVPSQTPVLAFTVSLHMPTAATIWQLLPISISVQRHRKSTADAEKAALSFLDIQFGLTSYTSIRPDQGDVTEASEIVAELECAPPSFARPKLPLDGTSVSVMTKTRLFDLVRDAKKLIPSFSTYTVSRHYALSVRGIIKHVDTGHVFPFSVQEVFRILPPLSPSAKDARARLKSLQASSEMSAQSYMVNVLS